MAREKTISKSGATKTKEWVRYPAVLGFTYTLRMNGEWKCKPYKEPIRKQDETITNKCRKELHKKSG